MRADRGADRAALLAGAAAVFRADALAHRPDLRGHAARKSVLPAVPVDSRPAAAHRRPALETDCGRLCRGQPIQGLHILVGAARRVYDTWVFARIHAQIATGTIARQRTAGVGTTEIASRSVMSRELVDFFEREVPTIVTAGLGLVGGMAMLLYDAWA